MKMKRLFVLVLLLIFFVDPSTGQVTLTPINDLSFGTVTGGTSTYVLVSDPGAAEFQAAFTAGRGDANATLKFVLPTQLTSGANAMPIAFGANSAAYNTTSSLSGSTAFDPSQGFTALVPAHTTVTYYVWIGGTVNPGTGQPAGTYTNTITIDGALGRKKTSLVVNATASIIQGLTLAATGALDFGQIIAGTIPPSLSAQANGSAPMFTATGNGGQQVWLTYSSSALYSGANTLTFSPSVYGNSTMSQAGSTYASTGSSIYLSGTAGSQGNYYFWLGGSLGAIPTGQVPGNYTGTFTLTVSY